MNRSRMQHGIQHLIDVLGSRSTIYKLMALVPGVVVCFLALFWDVLARRRVATFDRVQVVGCIVGLFLLILGIRLAGYPLRKLLPRLLLAVASVAFTLLVLETTYRVALTRLPQVSGDVEQFKAVSESIYRFNRVFGYEYVPGVRARTVRVREGRVCDVWNCIVNPEGNIGSPDISDGWRDSSTRILVVGDSFTANPDYEGIAWPDFLCAELKKNSAEDAAVCNYARDGYGILQMLTMAVQKAKESEPNLVIIAFIGDDLRRARFWRTQYSDGRYDRVFTTAVPESRPEVSLRAEACLVNPNVEKLDVGDDAVFLVEQFKELSSPTRAIYRTALLSPRHCFLFNRLYHGSPFFGIETPALNPEHDYKNFCEDSGFCADVAELHTLGVEVALVHIPDYSEIVNGRYRLGQSERPLRESLRNALISSLYIELLDYITPPQEGLLKAFMMPDDSHPSALGARMYGEAVARALNESSRSRPEP